MKTTVLSAVLVAAMAAPAAAQGELNVYSSRHYDTDDQLYADFTEATGITVNRVEDEADVLMARMQSEGELSPADVFITVDVGRITRAERDGLLQPIESEVVVDNVPENLRAASDQWTALTSRTRLIFFDKADVQDPPATYMDLADPKYRGMVCTRSSSNVYMLSLLSAIIANEGEDAAREWAEGVKANFAREPEGGDTDQLRAIVSGECDIVLSNHYYFARAMNGQVEGLSGNLDQIGFVAPDQGGNGTHVNVSAIGLAKNAPNEANARAFIEYLLTNDVQKLLADQNFEFPVVEGVNASEEALSFGAFERDDIALSEFAEQADAAQRIYNEVGYP